MIKSPERLAQESLDAQAVMLKSLVAIPVPDAVGVSLSYLLYCAYNHQDVLRRVMNEPVVREGFRGESMLTVLNRASRA